MTRVESTYTLTYFSKSALKGNVDSIKHQINELLAVAQKNNSSKSITGALLYSGGYFIQVLEGAQKDVEEVFELIMCDNRHSDITVLTNKHVAARSFSKWSMALAGVREDIPESLDGLLVAPEELVETESGMVLIDVMVELLNKYNSIEQM